VVVIVSCHVPKRGSSMLSVVRNAVILQCSDGVWHDSSQKFTLGDWDVSRNELVFANC